MSALQALKSTGNYYNYEMASRGFYRHRQHRSSQRLYLRIRRGAVPEFRGNCYNYALLPPDR
jgi:hypothetical protein